MKLINLSLIFIIGCGYSSQNNEITAQPKQLILQTPIVCSKRTDVDISLGVLRNGVGSMSTQDVVMYAPNDKDVQSLRLAIKNGSLVKIVYNEARLRWCEPTSEIVSVEILP